MSSCVVILAVDACYNAVSLCCCEPAGAHTFTFTPSAKTTEKRGGRGRVGREGGESGGGAAEAEREAVWWIG